MSTATVIRARIDKRTKLKAAAALSAMGLSFSEAIRLLMVRIAEEQSFPFAIRTPNAATRKALKERESAF